METLTSFHLAAWSLRRMPGPRDVARPPQPTPLPGAVRRLAAWLRLPRRCGARLVATSCCC